MTVPPWLVAGPRLAGTPQAVSHLAEVVGHPWCGKGGVIDMGAGLTVGNVSSKCIGRQGRSVGKTFACADASRVLPCQPGFFPFLAAGKISVMC